MQQYIAQRLLWSLPTLVLISMLIFGMVRIIPGDAITAQFTSQGNISAEDIEKARKNLGLDEPIVSQYFDWVSGILRGDFGDSLVTRTSVIDRIAETLPISLEIAVIGIVISLIVSMPTGILSAIKAGTPVDYIGRLFALTGLAVPSFWLGILL